MKTGGKLAENWRKTGEKLLINENSRKNWFRTEKQKNLWQTDQEIKMGTQRKSGNKCVYLRCGFMSCA